MRGSEMLLDYNKTTNSSKVKVLPEGWLVLKYESKVLNINGIFKLVTRINALHGKFQGLKFPLIIDLGSLTIMDKLCVTLLECVCYDLINRWGHRVSVSMKCETDICTDGIESSPLKLLGAKKDKNCGEYLRKFEDEIYGNHFRRVIHQSAAESGELGIVMGEIESFLKYFDVEESYRASLAEVVVELIGNAEEHAFADCLVDIDVSNPYRKVGKEGIYHGVNVAILNFSKIEFEEPIREKIQKTKDVQGRYQRIFEAYNNHKSFFSDDYREDDFFRICAFQDRITSREGKLNSGGMGLTKLISSLEKQSEFHRCYMLSGSRALWFRQEYLDYDEDGWIGFNNKNDYFNCMPDISTFSNYPLFMPGTAYNLNFVLKAEDYNDQENRTGIQ